MSQSLLAAEADQIQDLLFRASRLREVVGGSQLLMHFGDATTQNSGDQSALQRLLKRYDPPPTVITAGGGSFRLLFDSDEQDSSEKRAIDFGQKLAELYRLTTGGSLSVAQPVPYTTYRAAGQLANQSLRQAKRRGSGGQSTAHLPYVAFCASCGTALAWEHNQRISPEENEQYLCRFCRAKSTERGPANQAGSFLRAFFEKIVPGQDLREYDWPGTRSEIADPTEVVARFDPRNYVAYLVADGNNMGQIFSHCDENQARELSQGLLETVRKCLAEPTKLLLTHQPELKDDKFLPVLPLILGGDDLFALLPAPWALDFAGRFCQAYERHMQPWAEKFGVVQPTMGAAVVICKANYPYYLAHQAGEARLNQAKILAKQLALETGLQRSAVNFEIILSSQMVDTEAAESGIRNTLRPYWVGEDVPADWGLSLATLLDQRQPLSAIPRRRRAQLRSYFNQIQGLTGEEAQKHCPRLDQILARIGRNADHRQAVETALGILGDDKADDEAGNEADDKAGKKDKEWLRTISRSNASWEGHGLPDLLDAWDFTHKVDEARELEEVSA